MSWLLEFRPEVAQDVAEAAKWYESRETDLGGEFVEELIQVWERILENPFIGSRRHSCGGPGKGMTGPRLIIGG